MTDNMPRDTPARAPGCDYPGDFPPLYWMGVLGWQCRCMVCARCGHHTGNSNQGHHWKLCQVTGTMREFHFCCPGDCELEAYCPERDEDGHPCEHKRGHDGPCFFVD